MKNPTIDLTDLSRLSLLRNNDPMGFNCELKPESFYIAAMVEELGEIAGAIKRLERGYNRRDKLKLIKKLKATWEEKHPGMEEHFSELTDDELYQVWLKGRLKDFITESADLFLYLDILITRVEKKYDIQFDFFKTVQNKFNEVSLELNPQTTYII